MRLTNPINLRSMWRLFLESELGASQAQSTTEQSNHNWIDQVFDNAEMLDDYFSIELDPGTGELLTLPILLKGHQPNLFLLPLFVNDLQKVCWNKEKALFYTFGQVLADFYSYPLNDLSELRRTTELYVYPKIKEFFKPSAEIDQMSRKIADTSDLYKVFERC